MLWTSREQFTFLVLHDHSNRLLDLFSLLGFLVKPTSQPRTRTIRCDGGHYWVTTLFKGHSDGDFAQPVGFKL
jgi:hypothetical protein